MLLHLQGKQMEDQDSRARMKDRLNEVHDWPSLYMFKFIMEPDPKRVDPLLALFKEGSEVLRRYSKGGKYLSITVREVMMSAEEVVMRYEKVAEIEGVMAL